MELKNITVTLTKRQIEQLEVEAEKDLSNKSATARRIFARYFAGVKSKAPTKAA